MAKKLVTIEEVNQLNCIDFTHTFQNVVENYGVAAFHMSREKYHNVMDIYNSLCNVLDQTELYRKEVILQDHPGLLKQFGELVGLSPEERHKITCLVEEYELKFGFSFVICHKEYKIADILTAIKHRLRHNRYIEIYVSMEEIKKLSKYRILSLIKHEYA